VDLNLLSLFPQIGTRIMEVLRRKKALKKSQWWRANRTRELDRKKKGLKS
jgi:hypothetical protein